MAFKRTQKDQIDAGKKELPRKLEFLRDLKVDFLSFAHDDATGEMTVELTAAAVKALARKGVDLKELKASQKDLAKQVALVPALHADREQLTALRESSATTDEELRKAQRRVKALEKQLGIEPGAKPTKKATITKSPETADAPNESPTASGNGDN